MEQWMTPDLKKILMLLGFGAIGIAVLMNAIKKRIRRTFKPLSKRALYYLLIAAALFALTGLLIVSGLFSTYTSNFIFMQVIFLLLGILHLYAMQQKLPWGKEGAFWADFLFTFLVNLVGAICFLMVYRIVNREGMEWLMTASTLFFIIPLFVLYTFRAAMEIPPKLMKQWYYPVHQPLEEPDEHKLKNMLLISFEFHKAPGDTYFTNFRAKAPADMELRLLFYYFINDYNDRHPQGKIQYINGQGEAFGWMFYKKPKWYTIFTKYLDADKTVFINRVKENDVIVCARTYE